MRYINFNVSGQKLAKLGDFSNIIRGSKGYLKSSFIFTDDDWMKCTCIAVFEASGKDEYAVVLGDDNKCFVPNEVTDSTSFKVKLVGVKEDYKIETNKILVTQEG